MNWPRSPLDRHNLRVNRCRLFICMHLNRAWHTDQPPHPSHLRRRCRSDGWGRRGRGQPGTKAQLMALRSRQRMYDRRNEHRPMWVEWQRLNRRYNTSSTAFQLLCAQQELAADRTLL